VYALGRLTLPSHVAAVVAATLFAVHPCHTEAVSSIVGRAELLAALFVLLSVLSFAAHLRTAGMVRMAWGGGSVAALACGMLAKESAFAAIALIPVLHRYLDPQATLRQLARATVPYAALGAVYLALRLLIVGSLGLPAPPDTLDNPLAHVAPHVRLATAVVVLWEYVALLLVPARLAADYSFNEVPLVLTLTEPRLLFALAAFAMIGALLMSNARRAPGLVFGLWLGVIPLALTANVLFPIGTIKAERLLYLPSVGICLAAAALLTPMVHRPRRGWQLLVLLIIATFASRTWARNADWRDNLTLFQATVAASPHSAKAHHNLGLALQHAGRFDEALVHFQRALDIFPSYAEAAYGIGRVQNQRGNDVGALYWFRAALERNWQLAKAHLQIGMIYARRGAHTAAEAAFRSGLEVDPTNPILIVNLSASQMAQGDRWAALHLLDTLDHLPVGNPETNAVVAAARREIMEAAQ
jgi:Flp pilus assembly protein TadD